MKQGNVLDYLRRRGVIDSVSSEDLSKLLDQPQKLYIGFDPTAESLHLGNLAGIILLGWFQRFGHTPVVLLGGATGRIGDPSGKSHERPLLDDNTIVHNKNKIREIFDVVLGKNDPKPLILDNNDWFSGYHFLDFLRDVGKHMRVGMMLGKEAVRTRIQSSEGISFAEFSYQMIQAYDFCHLRQNYEVILQAGGSDQWGNITAGIELSRKLISKSIYGLTYPLLLRSDGKKYGKSEDGAVWLSSDLFSPYKFYQYLYGTPDSDVIKLMRMLTFLENEEISEIEASMNSADYRTNSAQKRLAEEVTRIVHGDEGVAVAQKVTAGAAPGSKTKLDSEMLLSIADDMPNAEVSRGEVIGSKYTELLTKVGLTASKGEATRLVKNGGAYLNNEKINDVTHEISTSDLIDDRFILFGIGKKKKMLVKVID